LDRLVANFCGWKDKKKEHTTNSRSENKKRKGAI